MDSLTTLTVGVVAPAWFQEPLAVLVYAIPSTRLWAYGSSVEDLLSLPIGEVPDLVLLYASDVHAASQVRQVKAGWPTARCVALIRERRQQPAVLEAGADLVLLQGVAPGRLVAAIEELHNQNAAPGIPSGSEVPGEGNRPESGR